jgi:hypothetical protein
MFRRAVGFQASFLSNASQRSSIITPQTKSVFANVVGSKIMKDIEGEDKTNKERKHEMTLKKIVSIVLTTNKQTWSPLILYTLESFLISNSLICVLMY